MEIKLISVQTGQPVPFRGADQSAIARRPITGTLRLSFAGLEGDDVADKVHHGGVDKALHLYPADHLPWWRDRLGDHPLLQTSGGFGENLSTCGYVESEARIGDRIRWGEALIEVSHGRQPCWKLDHHFGRSGRESVMAAIVRSAKSGLYFRVLQEGDVSAEAPFCLESRGDEEWTVQRVFNLLIAGGHRNDPSAIARLSRHPRLAKVWRQRAAELSG